MGLFSGADRVRRGAREAAEVEAVEVLQDARDALEQAQDLQRRADRTVRDAAVAHDEARRELRKIAESKVRAPYAS